MKTRNKELVIAFIISIILSSIFYYGYGNTSAVRTTLDMLWFNCGLLFLFSFLPLFVILKNKEELKNGNYSP